MYAMSDLTELDLPATMKTDFPDPTDLLNFNLTITPDEGVSAGYWKYLSY
jgi:ubiquitin-conjugating enzyme E2 M